MADENAMWAAWTREQLDGFPISFSQARMALTEEQRTAIIAWHRSLNLRHVEYDSHLKGKYSRARFRPSEAIPIDPPAPE